ncbi:hypothetical protein Aph02nite_89100 [Actinoplanes philippinensis]|nr:hypothetical protein Aph02nite_89100 [Actinoplanes philippinensis]
MVGETGQEGLFRECLDGGPHVSSSGGAGRYLDARTAGYGTGRTIRPVGRDRRSTLFEFEARRIVR